MELFPLVTAILIIRTKGQGKIKAALPGLYLAAITMYFGQFNAFDIADKYRVTATAFGPWTIPIYWSLLLFISGLQVWAYIY